ncbi:MAG: nitroreductase family protein [Bacteroidales bacterium]|nr:nitroreductase family protein [Bacteroidales bacterium]
MNSMNTRRTVRAYSDQPLDDHLLNDLLTTACRASNTGNMQAYSVVVTRDPYRKQLLAPLHFNQQQVIQAPVVLTFCADFNRFGKWCEQRHAVPGYDNLQALTYSAIDTVILAQAFCDAAEAKGLGICYLGTTTYLAEQIAEALELPKLVLPITTISVGYPQKAFSAPLSDRLPLNGILHQETYHDYTADAIDRIYAEKESLPENRNFVEINKKETLAQIFTDIRYTKNDNEHFSEAFLKAVRKQGFQI